ncbi:MAG: class I SAM-dependent methyltransferase [Asgard group archaeon]|nr:class I SAM-dependent methyltransferase [Asgard group archaeon]
MKEQELYRKLAKYYDFIYYWKDYEKEAAKVKTIIDQNKKSSGNELLDCGCGTGSHIQYLQKDFKCTGIDLNESIIKVAREKLPEITFILSDMSDLKFEKEFDVIISMFSAIAYILDKNALEKTFTGFANHLKKGGVLIIEPWLSKEGYAVGSPHVTSFKNDEVAIARVNISDLKDDYISYFEMHYLIAEKGKSVQHFVDKHELAIFPIEFLLSLCEKNNIKANHIKEEPFTDRGLIIGIKQ